MTTTKTLQKLHEDHVPALLPVWTGRELARRDPVSLVMGHRFREPELERQAYPWRQALGYALEAQDTLAQQQSLVKLASLVDEDRTAHTMEMIRRHHLSYVEPLGWMPVPDQPITVTCPDFTRWRIEPLVMERKEPLWIPREAVEILREEASAGIRFDDCLVLHELPSPGAKSVNYSELDSSLARNALRRGALVAGAAAGVLGVAGGVGLAVLQALSAVALDPSLVGVIKSLPESETGHWFVLVRWA